MLLYKPCIGGVLGVLDTSYCSLASMPGAVRVVLGVEEAHGVAVPVEGATERSLREASAKSRREKCCGISLNRRCKDDDRQQNALKYPTAVYYHFLNR